MDIDEFLDRELSDLGFQTDKAEKPKAAEEPQLKEDFDASPFVESIRNNLRKGKLEEADEAYVQLWHTLLEQKLKWNNELYRQLLGLGKQFAGMLKEASDETKRKADHIYEMIDRAKSALQEGKKDLPFKIYSEITEITSSIPNVFFEEKKIIQEQINDFYKELTNAVDSELVKRVSALVQETNQLIDRANMSIRANDMISAIVNYNKCIEMYKQIPEGFLKHKNPLGIRILDIYKSLSIYTEISNLQKQLGIKQDASTLQNAATAEQAIGKTMPSTAQAQVIRHLNYPKLQQTSHLPQYQRKASLNAITQATAAQESSQKSQQESASAKTTLTALAAKKERAKSNIKKGFYNEAYRDIQEALQLDPKDAEAKVMQAKIKTLQ